MVSSPSSSSPSIHPHPNPIRRSPLPLPTTTHPTSPTFQFPIHHQLPSPSDNRTPTQSPTVRASSPYQQQSINMPPPPRRRVSDSGEDTPKHRQIDSMPSSNFTAASDEGHGGTTVFDFRDLPSRCQPTGLGLSVMVDHASNLMPKRDLGSVAEEVDPAPARKRKDEVVLVSQSYSPDIDPASPELDQMASMMSILGPKMTIHSPAPWDLEEEAETTSVRSSSSHGRRSSEANSRRGNSSSSSSRGKENVTETAPKSTNASRARSFSTTSNRPPTAELGNSLASREALRGLGLGVGLNVTTALPLPPKKPYGGNSFLDMDDETPQIIRKGASSAPPELGTRPKRSQTLTSPPMVFEMITPGSLPWPSVPKPLANLTAKIPPQVTSSPSSRSLSSTITSPVSPGGYSRSPSSPLLYSPSMTLSEGESITTLGNEGGYKLISLMDARQRESDRKATSRSREPSTNSYGLTRDVNSLSTLGSTENEVPVAGGGVVKTVKAKKSGFLKRMMMGGGSGGVSPPTTPITPTMDLQPSKEFLQSLPEIYKLPPPPLPTATSRPSTGNLSFLNPPIPDPSEQRSKKTFLAPTLSLRPISTAFSAGLGDYLATQPIPTPLNSPLAPSFTSTTTKSSSIFEDSSSFSSATTTPLTPNFTTQSKQPLIGGGESLNSLKEEFIRASNAWTKKQWELETQIQGLKKELEGLKNEKCSCGTAAGGASSVASSILSRPKPVQATTAGGPSSLFGAGE